MAEFVVPQALEREDGPRCQANSGALHCRCQMCQVHVSPEHLLGPKHFAELTARLPLDGAPLCTDNFWQTWTFKTGAVAFNHVDGTVRVIRRPAALEAGPCQDDTSRVSATEVALLSLAAPLAQVPASLAPDVTYVQLPLAPQLVPVPELDFAEPVLPGPLPAPAVTPLPVPTLRAVPPPPPGVQQAQEGWPLPVPWWATVCSHCKRRTLLKGLYCLNPQCSFKG